MVRLGSMPNWRLRARAAGANASRGSCVWWGSLVAIAAGPGSAPPDVILLSPAACPAPDLVQRAFVAAAPNELWVSDITYVPTEQEGFLFLAVILDVFSRRVVGWSMADHLRAELVLAALNMAIWNRQPRPGLIHHSDHGCQYTAAAFEERCRALGIQCSMGTTGDCYDNALAESFFATLECELLDRWTLRTHDEARSTLFAFIESFYNRQRRHSALGYLSPEEFERRSGPTAPSVA